MPASISTSEARRRARGRLLLAQGLALSLAASVTLIFPSHSRAADDPAGAGKKDDRSLLPEEDDFSNTPFTEYGEFDEESDEAADTRFFQYGRFFGVSLGAGFQGVTGNRGLLWQGGFPTLDLHVHYWFDFNVALDLGGYYASHNYAGTSSGERISVSMFNLGLDVKYYFDTKNLAAPISFAGPYLLAGVGSFTRIDASSVDEQPTTDSTVGFTAGFGLEFALKPKKVYLTSEFRFHFVNFRDSSSQEYRTNPGIPDLSGFFYTLVGGILFTW